MCLCLQLNDAFTLYKKEKAENDKMLNETNDRLQKQLTELRSSHAKLTSQLEFSSKRFVRSDAPPALSSAFVSVEFIPSYTAAASAAAASCVCLVCGRYEMHQESVSAYRREVSALQDRNQKMAVMIQRHEHVIHTMSQDLRQANEKLALEEVRKRRCSNTSSQHCI